MTEGTGRIRGVSRHSAGLLLIHWKLGIVLTFLTSETAKDSWPLFGKLWKSLSMKMSTLSLTPSLSFFLSLSLLSRSCFSHNPSLPYLFSLLLSLIFSFSLSLHRSQWVVWSGLYRYFVEFSFSLPLSSPPPPPPPPLSISRYILPFSRFTPVKGMRFYHTHADSPFPSHPSILLLSFFLSLFIYNSWTKSLG